MGTLTPASVLTAAALAVGSFAVASASAQTTAVPATPVVAVGAPSGGALAADVLPPAAGVQPTITGVLCRATCAGLLKATAGSTVHVTGTALAGATFVVFAGGRSKRDDVQAPVIASTPESADVVVPASARSGPLRVIGATGRWSKATRRRLAIGKAVAAPGGMLQATVEAERVFLDGRSRPSVSYLVGGRAPAAVRVDLVREDAATGEVPVASWTPSPLPAGSVDTIAWDGALAPVAPPEGRYEFRVTAAQGRARVATSAFTLVGHAFPVQGANTIGSQPTQVFGAARSGRTHQGQDVFAECGTPIVAVSSGVVRYRSFQAAAGNYLVLRQDGDGTDFLYMHLRDPALAGKGTRVTTGQLLGYVGDTGRADGCHLHFEQWLAPGWYTGGAPVDPLPALTAWDAAL